MSAVNNGSIAALPNEAAASYLPLATLNQVFSCKLPALHPICCSTSATSCLSLNSVFSLMSNGVSDDAAC